ncbi:MAG TPA: redox-sensing transcriptional repressor Rex [Candidatus Omnitrophota bacterium]|nr:redox-sensing transcriptional repressor Rex [Candidatus Omnitrophota bacterium]
MKVSNKLCVSRLYMYRKALSRFKQMGCIKIFSDNLADGIGVTSSQVRKDFSIFGLSGNKKGGYLVEDLIQKLDEILGKNKPQRVIVIGAGNIGTALMKYKAFVKEGLEIAAAFDTDSAKVDRADEIPVLPLSELADFVRQNDIRVGIIAVPDIVAQEVLNVMISAGIRGALNFAPIRLNVPEDFIINNVNVGVELETVIYMVNALDRRPGNE